MIAQAMILVHMAVSVMRIPNKLTPKMCFSLWIAISCFILLLLWTDALRNTCFL